MTLDNPVRFSFLVNDVSRLHGMHYDRLMKPYDLTRSQYWVISNLSRTYGDGMTQTELAEHMSVGKVTLGGLIDRLELRGYVERHDDPVDRRSKRVYLTSDGKKLVKKMGVLARDFNAELLEGMSQDDLDAAERVLDLVKHRLLELDAK